MLRQRKLYEEWAACDWDHSAGYDHLAGCMLASVAYGSNLIPIGQVLQALQNPDSGTFEASVVWARIPRTVFGVLAGAALGVSGALMQAVTRNPIADPSVLESIPAHPCLS